MTGLPITDSALPKGAVYAALKLLDDEFTERDILHVRKMRLIPRLEPLNPTTSTTDAESADAEESLNGNAEGNPTRSPPSSSSSQSTSVDARSRTTPLIVVVSSHTLAMSLTSAKTKMGKLHTSQLSAELLELAKVTTPLPPSFININELLPAALHRLRSLARIEAKKKGFISYVRSGRIYIKKKKADQATVISSIEELNNFLA